MPLEHKIHIFAPPRNIFYLFFSCIAKLAQVHRVKHMFDIETPEVKQPFYMQSVNICIVQPCRPARPLQKITTLLVR